MLQAYHTDILTKYVPKFFITCKFPHLSQPVTIITEIANVQCTLAELLDLPEVEVFEHVSIPQFVDGDFIPVHFTHKEILDGNFKVQSDFEV